MKQSISLVVAIIVVSIIVFSFSILPQDKDIIVINTIYGEMKIKLYDETPLHKANFIKLVSENFFDDLLFHRVIKDFMIQGGDPDSKNASPVAELGNGGPGYNISAEFIPSLYHKKGVIAAAREADQINPKKESSGSQFYIVQGKVFTNQELNIIENKINQNIKNKIIEKILMSSDNMALRTKFDSIKKSGSQDAMINFNKEIEPIAEKELDKQGHYKFTPEQRKIYTTIGGTPHLDGNYTIFGEVIEGFNVIDSIAAVKTGKNNRPLVDVKMKIRLVK